MSKFNEGEKVFAWNPHVIREKDHWVGGYQLATIVGLMGVINGDEDYYMVDFGEWMSGRTEGDLVEFYEAV